MREIEVVPPLHHVVGIFVAEREADAQHLAVVADDVEAGDLALLAAVLRVARKLDRLLRRDQPGAVALVGPFRLHADRAGGRLAALDAELEHLHGVGEVGALQLRVHGIARLRAAEMGQAGQRHDDARRLGMIERQQDALFGDQRVVVHRVAEAVRLDGCRQRALRRDALRAPGRARSPRPARRAARRRRRSPPTARAPPAVDELDETHSPPRTTLAASHPSEGQRQCPARSLGKPVRDADLDACTVFV